MTRGARAALAAAAVAAGAALWALALGGGGPEVEVAPGRPLQAAVDEAVPGTTVNLASGVHEGPVVVTRDITLQGAPGAVVTGGGSPAALIVKAAGAEVRGVTVEGADTGILVREVDGVVLEDVTVADARLHGIEIVDASARIERATVGGLHSPLAQGIEIRNSDGRPDSVVQDSVVEGGMEGIVSHVSEVVFSGNRVTGTSLRGIVITEMSDGWVTGNVVRDAAGAGFYCGDMSRCHLEANSAVGVGAVPGGTSAQGWGAVVTYHAAAHLADNELAGDSGPVLTSLGGHVGARSPLDPGTLGDVAPELALSLGIAAALGALGYLLAARLPRKDPRPAANPARISVALAIATVVMIQSFHMVEHFLQIYRIHVDHIPSRGGLAGPGVDTEWVHMAYNAAVFGLLVLAARLFRGRVEVHGIRLLGGAVLLQSWHVVEHVAKTTEHVLTGAKVNEGLLGRYFDLAWFHFTINAAVYGMSLAAAAICLAWIARSARRSVGLGRAAGQTT